MHGAAMLFETSISIQCTYKQLVWSEKLTPLPAHSTQALGPVKLSKGVLQNKPNDCFLLLVLSI